MDEKKIDSPELIELKQKRAIIKGQLTRFKNFIDKLSDDLSQISQLPYRLESCRDLLDRYNDAHMQILHIDFEHFDEHTQQLELFEDTFFQTIAKANEHNNYNNQSNSFHSSCSKSQHSHTSNHSQQVNQNNIIKTATITKSQSNIEIPVDSVQQKPCIETINNSQFMHGSPAQLVTQPIKLPTIELPSYQGSCDKWLQFHDTFESLIHKNSSLSNIQKFYYLKSCLKGDAEDVIHSLEVTDSNYNIAWQVLKDRYQNNKLVIHNHIRSLFELPVITKESFSLLRKLIDEVNKNLRVLKSFNQPVEYWDTILIYLITTKLDTGTKREWESINISNDVPNLNSFTKFLADRCQLLETLHVNKDKTTTDNNSAHKSHTNKFCPSKSFVTSNNSDHKFKCLFCNENHLIYYCSKFLNLPIKNRKSEVIKLKLCLNCFKSNHTYEKCTSGGCKHCGKKHNSLLHFFDTRQSSQTANNQTESVDPQSNKTQVTPNKTSNIAHTESVTTHSHCSKDNGDVILATVIVDIIDKSGQIHQARALLDSGSQSNFMTREMCEELELEQQNIAIPVAGMNLNITNIDCMTSAKIRSRVNSYQLQTKFLILDKITENLPTREINKSQLTIPNNIVLADHTFHVPSKIDILLGAPVFYDLLCIGQIRTGKNQPVFQKTKFGWVVSGNTLPYNDNQQKMLCHFSNIEIQDQLEKFWQLEDISQERKFSKEEQECETEFQNQIRRLSNGHFEVPMLTKPNLEELGDSYHIASKRFSLLENKLSKNDKLREKYNSFMEEYISLGHMSKIEGEILTEQPHYYLPHHGVLKENNLTTKLRVVFDGSCKTDSGVSLNDKLKVGPTIQQDLVSILIRFRKHNIVIASDIEKMYRQILIKEDQRDLQRIFWRSNPETTINHYQLNTVTYGTASAPYLAIRSLQQTSLEHEMEYPHTSQVIKNDFYVDDLLTGSHDIQSTRQLRRELQVILSKYGFVLRKWTSNSREVIEDIQDNRQNVDHFISDNKVNKTLGLFWDAESDTLHFKVSQVKEDKATKRSILSIISQIFDPLGLVAPCIVKAKIIIQRLWKLNLGWDESLPHELYTVWQEFIDQLSMINDINIPRQVTIPNSIKIQIHGFSDASEVAYGACVYIRSTDESGNHAVKLLCSKSKVAPLKNISLPKLELCGAIVLSRLTQKVINSIDLPLSESQIFYWTDSTIVLSWINGEPHQWKIFIANRVSEIQQHSKINQWNHVSTKQNPADIISRGSSPSKLADSNLWWKGPYWLSENQEKWPDPKYVPPKDVPESRRRITALQATISVQSDIFKKYSSLSKLQNIVAYILRFKHNALNKHNKHTGYLQSAELDIALNCLIRIAQKESFLEEIKNISKGKPLNSNSKILALNPFIDENNLLRVGGRLKHAHHLNIFHKHPIILPQHHTLTQLIVKHYHYKTLHSGTQALLSHIRTRYWPISGKRTVKSVLKSCIVCFKVKPVSLNHIMGDLPAERITPSRPFLYCGVDYCGPFNTKISKVRNSKVIKIYLCIFVCFSTKACHLELVNDLSTDAFLNCLKRFISRRGKPIKIFSDNATNFVGANHELQKFVSFINDQNTQSKLRTFLEPESISWNFIPARSPHMGGLWEAAVKAAKYHLYRVMGNLTYTFEQLHTVVVQIEACLNSRPITPLSSDPSDYQALTPGQFLIGCPLISFSEPDLHQLPSNRLSQYQHLTSIIQHFWRRWSVEYISQLQGRVKWKVNSSQLLQPGALVLMKEDHLPPLKWKMGRISRVITGPDNVARVAVIRTTTGEVNRSVRKLCVLPSGTEDHSIASTIVENN